MGSTNGEWASMPIAIIGLSCKFAGDASSASKLWEMLAEGKSAWSEIPPTRFNVKGTHHPDHERIYAVSGIWMQAESSVREDANRRICIDERERGTLHKGGSWLI
jgi:hypothetical protein